MKDYLLPISNFALAIAIGSLPFTIPLVGQAQISQNGTRYSPVYVEITNPSSIGCN